VYDLGEMEQYLTASGFKDFQPEVSGSILTFCARKQAARLVATAGPLGPSTH